ncbi:MAG: alanine--glyoxylate aminotransferase family protein [Rhodospirillales bacterium]|nr:alanine--glyoxylate aminotransferase family protein [Rhodospirillales bacterium]
MTAKSFNPPVRVLMGPGPSDVHPRVLSAMARPTIGHLDPAFVGMMDELKDLIRYTFQTENQLTIPVSAPGSSGMEACFVNLVEPGDSVIVCRNGVFGMRMTENVERCGGMPILIDDDWGKPVDLNKVEEALKANPGVKALAFVHAETSTGVRSDAAALCALAQEHGALSIVDTVTSLGGLPVEVDKWGADAVYSGTQKCISCPPGLSPVTFNERAAEAVKARKTKVQSWFLDMSLVMSYWGDGDSGARSYHHTAPINALYGLHEALVMVQEEGIENAWARHAKNHDAFRAGLEAMGVGLLVDKEYRLPSLNTVLVPDGVDEAAVRTTLLQRYNLEIGAGLGALAGKVWRIGMMGTSSTPHHVTHCLSALEGMLSEFQADITTGVATGAAEAVLFGD